MQYCVNYIAAISTLKLYQESDLEPLQKRRKLRRFSLFHKIYKEHCIVIT